MTNPGPGKPNVRRAVFVTVVTALICVPILAVAQYVSHIRFDEYDSWLFAYYGRQLLEGRELYSEVWDNKPPGIFWVNAVGLWLSGGSIAGPITMCAIASVAACAIVFGMALRLYGWAAAGVSAVLAAVYLFVHYYHVGCNRPNTFVVVTELAAFLLYFRSLEPSRRPARNLLLAGVCAGLSIWFKQTGLAAAAGIGAHHVYLFLWSGADRRHVARRALLFAGGWLLAGAAVVVLLAVTSDLGWAWHALVAFNREYFAPGVGSRWWPRWFGQREHAAALALPAILAAATLVWPLVRWLWSYKGPPVVDAPGHRPPGLVVALWAWMVAAVYLALIGPHQRMPYWGIALPPLVMLASQGVHLLLQSGRIRGMDRPAFHVVVVMLWLGYMMTTPLGMQTRELLRQRWHARDEVAQRRFNQVVEAIRAVSRPDETLFVWDYNPKLYWAADRPSAIRYIATEKATQLGARGQPILDEIVALLQAARPRAIVANPRYFRVNSEDRREEELDLGGLPQWLRTNYTQPDAYRKQHLWVRNDCRVTD